MAILQVFSNKTVWAMSKYTLEAENCPFCEKEELLEGR
jgi:hypothetical protein